MTMYQILWHIAVFYIVTYSRRISIRFLVGDDFHKGRCYNTISHIKEKMG